MVWLMSKGVEAPFAIVRTLKVEKGQTPALKEHEEFFFFHTPFLVILLRIFVFCLIILDSHLARKYY